ncbi:MAG: hypothetical protein GYB67_19540 [Chloroflexi bacterium]|nr:hypothetical protein [Chloroflexota bacterium]
MKPEESARLVTQPDTQLSGLYYPNRFARHLYLALAGEIGESGLNALLSVVRNMTPQYAAHIDQLPVDNLDRAYDFALLAALNHGLDRMYGPRGGRGMALRVGQRWFRGGMQSFGALAGMSHPQVRALPEDARVALALRSLVEMFARFSDQATRLDAADDVQYIIVDPSPLAWGQTTERPTCHLLVGVFAACLDAVAGQGRYVVRETQCRASGAPLCRFEITPQTRA